MAPPHWLMAPLILGASATSLAVCGCSREDDAPDRRRDVMAAARSLLVAASIQPNRVMETLDRPPTVPEPTPTGTSDPFGADGAAAIGLQFPTLAWGHPLAHAGKVTISHDLCTGCEMCATVCASDALRTTNGSIRRIDFDATLCTACGQCIDRCPEPGAIDLTTELDGAALASGRRTLVELAVATCQRCGGQVAPHATLERLRSNLDDGTFQLISSTCLKCRGIRL